MPSECVQRQIDLLLTCRQQIALRQVIQSAQVLPGAAPAASFPRPASFANGRYTVLKCLGEGGKKNVHLAHDSLQDRYVMTQRK